ncbi:MAG TPA: oligoribonuclease [Polyangiaceae bacterium]
MGDRRARRKQAATNLCWLDLEMTGLDEQNDAIIQAALIVTNAELEPLEEFVCDIWQPEAALAKMTPFVREMHEKTGLLERVRKSTIDLGAAEKALIERVTGWCTYPATLCGSSIGYDKRFVDRWMPGLSGYLSYRTIDVSSLKLLARLWYGDSAGFQKQTEGEHDALFDIRQSLTELGFYRKTIFLPPPEKA